MLKDESIIVSPKNLRISMVGMLQIHLHYRPTPLLVSRRAARGIEMGSSFTHHEVQLLEESRWAMGRT